MKKIIVAILLCFSFSTIYAQTEKKIKRLIEENEELIADLKSKKDVLDAELNRINTEIAQIENRSFARETPEQSLKRRLSSYKNVEELSKKMPRNLNRNSPLVDSYYYIIEMYESVLVNNDKKPILKNETHGYDKLKNDYYKSNIEAFRHQVNTVQPQQSFIQSFETLVTQINDYRFTMFELIRVFDLVDEKIKNGMESASIYSSLKADEETEFVDKIPFTKSLLLKYIKTDDIGRKDIRGLNVFNTIK